MEGGGEGLRLEGRMEGESRERERAEGKINYDANI